MPQRPEDYMSTKNVGGNRPGGTDAKTNDPFSYVKLGENHSYLGHFRQQKYLEEGHNTRRPKVRGVNAAGKVEVQRKSGAVVAKSANSLKAGAARRAIRAGGAAGEAVAREKPVVAARMALRSARKEVRQAKRSGNPAAVVAAREARMGARKNVGLAKANPESARSERRSRRITRRGGGAY